MKRVKNLFKFAKGYYWMMTLIIFFVIFGRFTYSYVPLFTQYLIAFLKDSAPGAIYKVNFPNFVLDFFQPNDGLNTVLKVVTMLAVFQAFRFFMIFLEALLRGRLSENIQKKLRNEMYEHIQSLEYKYHNNVDIGDLIQRVTSDIEMIGGFLSERVAEAIRLVATVTFGAIQIYFISPTMMYVAMVMIPITATTSIFFFRYVNKAHKVIEEKEASMITIIQENLNASKIVRAFANEPFEIEKMEQANQGYSKELRKFQNIQAIHWGVSDTVAMLQYVLTIFIAIGLTRNSLISSDQVVAVLMLIGMLIWPIRGLGRMIGDFGRALVSTDRIMEVLDIPSEFNLNGTETPKIKGMIEFKDVSFKFSDSNDHLLNQVNFTINPGETVVFIGRTGSGKSTIVNLLTRMLEVTEGDILMDGVSIKDIEKHHLRKNLGVVLQEPFLYSKTVYENIAISNRNIISNDVYKAAQIASLQRDISTFDKGYDTVVGEKGTTLSGGQKQRVAIARILVTEKPILIFDDSLSAVDTQTDFLIRQALETRDIKSTTIIITHRITTAKQADKIIVLDNGQVSDIGTHETLKNKEGLYKKLWDIQGSLEEEFLQMVEEV